MMTMVMMMMLMVMIMMMMMMMMTMMAGLQDSLVATMTTMELRIMQETCLETE